MQYVKAFFVSFQLGWLDSKAHHNCLPLPVSIFPSSLATQLQSGPCLSCRELYLQNPAHHSVYGKQSVELPSLNICFFVVSHSKARLSIGTQVFWGGALGRALKKQIGGKRNPHSYHGLKPYVNWPPAPSPTSSASTLPIPHSILFCCSSKGASMPQWPYYTSTSLPHGLSSHFI